MSNDFVNGIRQIQSTTDPELLLKLRVDQRESGILTLKAAAGMAIGNLALTNIDDELVPVSPYAWAETIGDQTTVGGAPYHQLLAQNYQFDTHELDETLLEMEEDESAKLTVSGNFMIMHTLEWLSVFAEGSVQRDLYSLAGTALSGIWTPPEVVDPATT